MRSTRLSAAPTGSRFVSLARAIVRVAAVVLVLNGFSLHADDPFEELRLRIEKLENENAALQRRFDSDSQLTSYSPEIPPSPDDASDPSELQDETEEERRVGGLIERYLRRRGQVVDETDVAQDGRISFLDGKVSGILDRLNKKTYPTFQVYGALQADTGYFIQDANSVATYGQIANGADFRRARLGARGAINETVNYVFQMDFAFFGRPTFTDVYVEQSQIPYLGTVRIGQWKQPFSLEVVSSYRYSTFMERSVLFQSFTPFRHIGIGFYDNSEDLKRTWAASVFAAGQDHYGDSLFVNQTSSGAFTNFNMGGVATAERYTWLPYWDECTNGENYLHLGAGHYFSAPPGQSINFRTIPEIYIGQAANLVMGGSSGLPVPAGANGTPSFVQTGALSVNYFNVLGSEFLWVKGPLSVQSEGMINFVTQDGVTAALPGMYSTVGYFLTGEHRPYDRKAGAIDRVIPFKNFGFNKDGCNTGMGACEVALRYSYINLNDKSIQGGVMSDYTAGVNWYLNPYVKLVLNYVHSSSNYSGPGGLVNGVAVPSRRNETDMIAARCQMDF